MFRKIVPTQPWSDEEEVIKRANSSLAGLGACVWGADVEHAERIARRLEAGSVWVNSWEKPTPQALFGGHKESGIGGGKCLRSLEVDGIFANSVTDRMGQGGEIHHANIAFAELTNHLNHVCRV